jgi:hypothetical protein
LHQSSVFDPSQTKCQWTPSDPASASTSGSCDYLQPDVTLRVIVIVSMLVAVLTAPVNLVVDFLFHDILSAPTADTLKTASAGDAMRRAGRRMSNAVRRASLTVSNQLSALGPKKKKPALFRAVSTREISESTKEAHGLAVMSAANIIKELNARFEEEHASHAVTAVVSRKTGHIQANSEDAFSKLRNEIMLQRRNLRPSQWPHFDRQWG